MKLLICFPILTMHFCTYVIIDSKGDIETQVALALTPFDDDLEVEYYKTYLEEAEIERMAGCYGISAKDLPSLAEKMVDWRGSDGGHDEIGLFAWRSDNPEGHWDWYEIGGRWNGRFKGRNVIRAKTLFAMLDLKEFLPHCIIGPDGGWYEVESIIPAGFCNFGTVRKSDGQWLVELKQILASCPRSRVVCVDIHQ